MRRVAGLKELAGDYDALLCDVWGVLHNGVARLSRRRSMRSRASAQSAGPVVLITNAPRPHAPIREQLRAARRPRRRL